MPPKAKYSREEIAAAAFDIIKREGLNALTARELGRALGTSARPIFTAFTGMDEVKLAARELAMAEFKEYISDYREYTPAFKRIGMMVVSYGVHEPELFKLLFMQEQPEGRDFHDMVSDLGEIGDVCKELICRDYDMTVEEADILFEQMIALSFGLGAMCAMRVCRLSEEEIARRQAIMFASHVGLIKSGQLAKIHVAPEKKADGFFHGMPVSKLPFGIEKPE